MFGRYHFKVQLEHGESVEILLEASSANRAYNDIEHIARLLNSNNSVIELLITDHGLHDALTGMRVWEVQLHRGLSVYYAYVVAEDAVTAFSLLRVVTDVFHDKDAAALRVWLPDA